MLQLPADGMVAGSRPWASGLAGGEAGQSGANWARRKDGRMERLQGCDETVIDADEAVIIQSPTAGGYGEKRHRMWVPRLRSVPKSLGGLSRQKPLPYRGASIDRYRKARQDE